MHLYCVDNCSLGNNKWEICKDLYCWSLWIVYCLYCALYSFAVRAITRGRYARNPRGCWRLPSSVRSLCNPRLRCEQVITRLRWFVDNCVVFLWKYSNRQTYQANTTWVKGTSSFNSVLLDNRHYLNLITLIWLLGQGKGMNVNRVNQGWKVKYDCNRGPSSTRPFFLCTIAGSVSPAQKERLHCTKCRCTSHIWMLFKAIHK